MDDNKKSPFGYDEDEHDSAQSGHDDESFSYDEPEETFSEAYEHDPLGEDDEEQNQSAHEESDEEEYQFLDEDEVSELELDEEQPGASNSFVDMIRAKIEPMIGEENFDRLKGMAIPILVAAVVIIFFGSRLLDLFSTPTQPTTRGTAQVPTQITQVQTPKQKEMVTSPIVRPGQEQPAQGPKATETPTTTENAETGVPNLMQGLTPPAATSTTTPEQTATSGQGAGQMPAQTAPQQPSSTVSSWRSIFGGESQPTDFQLQPGQPGYTAAIPNETLMKAIQKDHEEQNAKLEGQLKALDDQAKGTDERLLRLEKMQESLDTKMTAINEQLDKVGKSMATLSKTLKERPKRDEFTYHGEQYERAAPSAQAGMPQQGLAPGQYRGQLPQYQGQGLAGQQSGQTLPGGIAFETPYYHVEAVVPGRAWLKDQTGQTVTVSKGDQLRGYGYVTYIDPENGIVVTSSGIVIRYGIDTR